MAINFETLSWHALLTASIIHTRLNQEAENVIAELLQMHDYDEVFVDFTQCLLLINRAQVKSDKNLKITACLHDVFAQRMIRSSRWIDTALTGLVCRQEQELIRWSVELGRRAKKGRFKKLLSELSPERREELLSSISPEEREKLLK